MRNEISDPETEKAAHSEINESIHESEIVNAKSDDGNDKEQT